VGALQGTSSGSDGRQDEPVQTPHVGEFSPDIKWEGKAGLLTTRALDHAESGGLRRARRHMIDKEVQRYLNGRVESADSQVSQKSVMAFTLLESY
jgi:hypothetical protein